MPTAPTRRADRGLPETRRNSHRTDTPDAARLRRRVARAIEGLIGLLDALDPDPDLEDESDLEPSLGATEGMNQVQSWKRPPHDPTYLSIDAEEEHDGCEDGGDDEPSLGALNWDGKDGDGASQKGWGTGCANDLEQDDADEDESSDEDLSMFPWKTERLRDDGKIDQARADLDAIERRKHGPASERDPDEIVPLGDGRAFWAGPAALRAK